VVTQAPVLCVDNYLIGRDLRWPSGLPRNPANLLPMTINSVLSDGLHTRNGRRPIVCCNRTRGWRRSCEASRNGLSGCRRSASPRLAAPLRRRRPNNPRSSGRKSRLRKLTCPPVIISGSSVISLMDRATGRNEIGVSGGADGPPSKQESKNMAYIYLTAAIITEVIGTLALKASDGLASSSGRQLSLPGTPPPSSFFRGRSGPCQLESPTRSGQGPGRH
jgi:hypothetical protein